MSEAAPTIDRLRELSHDLSLRCLDHGVRVATAESCTGGLVGHVCTDVPGSSAWFVGGVIAYGDEVKRGLLGVSAATITAHGAVSAQVAVAMADGVRRRLGTDVAVSVTGIAGPTGASDTKPVGLTYVAVADDAGHEVRRHVWSFDRAGNKRASAAAALMLLLERVGHE